MMKSALIASPGEKRKTTRNGIRKRRRVKRQQRPTIRFSPYAWAKLLFLRDAGDTEIGGFGISRADDLLFVEDVRLVRQVCSEITVSFDDAAVADFFDEQIDAGRRPEQFARIWVHTHPGLSALPSATDEETFDRCFGGSDWTVMFILARGGEAYSRLRFSVGPQTEQRMNVEVDYGPAFDASDEEAWAHEFEAHVRNRSRRSLMSRQMDVNGRREPDPDTEPFASDEWLENFAADPLFLDWEDTACQSPMAAMSA